MHATSPSASAPLQQLLQHRQPRAPALLVFIAVLLPLTIGALGVATSAPGGHQRQAAAGGRAHVAAAFMPACSSGRCNAHGQCRSGMRLRRCGDDAAHSAAAGAHDEQQLMQQEVASCGFGACSGHQDFVSVGASKSGHHVK
eukprot:jgi/Ulvmu1/11973/UM082_0052.1